jgi:hypothetical protein
MPLNSVRRKKNKSTIFINLSNNKDKLARKIYRISASRLDQGTLMRGARLR